MRKTFRLCLEVCAVGCAKKKPQGRVIWQFTHYKLALRPQSAQPNRRRVSTLCQRVVCRRRRTATEPSKGVK